jgi:hypothetical protein
MSNDVLGVRRPERDMLRGFLDWYRAVVTNKLVGLSLEQASQVMTPTGLSPLGILKHLASSEAGWLRGCFAGQPVPAEVAGPQSFRVAPHDTIDSVVAVYRDECTHSCQIADAATSLDQLSARPADPHGHVSLRWILIHLLEETARHAGHLDLMRETLDGRTGD